MTKEMTAGLRVTFNHFFKGNEAISHELFYVDSLSENHIKYRLAAKLDGVVTRIGSTSRESREWSP